jgi:paraquat-inducible protein B
MSRRANPALVGGFVLGALALVVVGILVLGGGQLFSRPRRFVVYFEGSVNGLAVGSPVKVAGVPVGQVDEIEAILDADTWSVLTQTVIEVDPKRFERRGVKPGEVIPMKELIDHGLRARLETQSLLTGQLYIELSFKPDTPARLVASELPYPQIPSLPTTVQELEAQVRQVLSKLAQLPLEDIVNHLEASLTGVDRIVNDPEIPQAIQNLNATLAQAQQALETLDRLGRRVDGEMGPLAQSVDQTLEDTRKAIEDVRTTFAAGSPLSYQLSGTLDELDRTIRAVRRLAQEIERNPRALVFGRSEEK